MNPPNRFAFPVPAVAVVVLLYLVAHVRRIYAADGAATPAASGPTGAGDKGHNCGR